MTYCTRNVTVLTMDILHIYPRKSGYFIIFTNINWLSDTYTLTYIHTFMYTRELRRIMQFSKLEHTQTYTHRDTHTNTYVVSSFLLSDAIHYSTYYVRREF